MWITSDQEYQGLAERLRVEHRGRRVDAVYLPEVDSTNTWVKRHFATSESADTVVAFARNQTGGRGTRNRSWVMQPGLDIALSIGVGLPAGASVDQRLSLAVGGAVARELGQTAGISTYVKWPNDVLLECGSIREPVRRKVCGILLETSVATVDRRALVIGCGVNVNSLPEQYPPELRSSLTSLREVTGTRLNLTQVAEAMAEALLRVAETCAGEGLGPWLAEWHSRDVTGGTRYILNRDEAAIPVVALRVDPHQGCLCVADRDGKEYLVTSYTELSYPEGIPR